MYGQLWNFAKSSFSKSNIALEKPIIVCHYDRDFVRFFEEEKHPLHFFVIDQMVYITHNTSPLHICTQNDIMDSFLQSLNNQVPGAPFMVYSGTFSYICNKFACHSIQEKYPDGSIIERSMRHKNYLHPLIVLEVAFKHECLAILAMECACYLTEYTRNTVYSIGVLISPSTQQFQMILFVFERLVPPNNEAISNIERLYHDHIYFIEGAPCRLKGKIFDGITMDDFFTPKNIERILQVTLLHFFKIDESTIVGGHAIRLNLNGVYFGSSEDIVIEISNETLQGILSYWYEDRENS